MMSMNPKPQTAALARLWLVALAAIFAGSGSLSAPALEAATLGIDGSRFTLSGNPTFLLGLSY
jgi:hypothetical protein